MEIPEKNDQDSSLANKRKRGRPRRDESQAHVSTITTDENLIGQVVYGVVEGSFEAGYFLNVKVADTEKQLKGVVFLPERVTPVTPTTDLFPLTKMYGRKNIPVPSLSQQTPSQGKKDAGNQTENLRSAENRSLGVGSVAIDERNDPMDVGGSYAEEKLIEPEGQTLSLMPQFDSGDAPKEDDIVVGSEACAVSKTAVILTTISPKDSTAEGTGTLLGFFPGLETSRKQGTGSSSTLSLELFQNETKQSETDGEPRGLELMVEGKQASPVDDVPEELQLELGNKKMSASATATETNPDQSASLYDGRVETGKKPEEANAASASGFLEVTQTEHNDS